MKVETPQILWHNTQNGSNKENGKSFPILSCHLVDTRSDEAVLATAGGNEVNLWLVRYMKEEMRIAVSDENKILVKPTSLYKVESSSLTTSSAGDSQNLHHTQIRHLVTLSRNTNDRTINCIRFSPDASHLAAVGDAGLVLVWSLPGAFLGLANEAERRHSRVCQWSSILEEKDLKIKILFNQSDDVMDLSWSDDSRRFMVCSLDHTVAVFESGFSTSVSGNSSSSNQCETEWRVVHRSTKDHTHYVQGVAYDPKGVYLASQASDRTVKVYTRKNLKEKDVKEAFGRYEENKGKIDDKEKARTILQSKVMPELLSRTKFELQNKTKTIKFLSPPDNHKTSASEIKCVQSDNEQSAVDCKGKEMVKRHHIFADELTVGSFFRRLAFTPDGAFLIVPAALWHGIDECGDGSGQARSSSLGSPKAVANHLTEPSFATYIFARHHFDRPFKVFAGLEKPSVVVRPNPVLFQLPTKPSQVKEEARILPYRCIIAVLTIDTVLIYDTHNDHPLAVAKGLHYAGFTDAIWSTDGRTLFVTSLDGYISIISFSNGELEEPVLYPQVNIADKLYAGEVLKDSTDDLSPENHSCIFKDAIPPETTNLVPKKKKKVTLNLEANITTVIENISGRVKLKPILVVNTLVPKKKAKPTSVATDVGNIDVSKRLADEIDQSKVALLVPVKKTKVS